MNCNLTIALFALRRELHCRALRSELLYNETKFQITERVSARIHGERYDIFNEIACFARASLVTHGNPHGNFTDASFNILYNNVAREASDFTPSTFVGKKNGEGKFCLRRNLL